MVVARWLFIVVFFAVSSKAMTSVVSRLKGFDVIHVGARPCVKKKNLIVMFPGNPGIPEYYEEFAVELARASCTSVAVVGWLGFSATTPLMRVPSADSVSLEKQIAHGREVVGSLAKDCESVALVGHSIGALVAMEILKEPPKNTDIRAVVKVTPFVAENFENPIYRQKVKSATTPGLGILLMALALFLRMLPLGLRARVLALAGQPTHHMKSSAINLTLDAMTRPPNIYAMLTMGRSEFLSPRILQGPDFSWLDDHRHKVSAIYAAGTDAWVRKAANDQMQRAGVQTLIIDSDHDVPVTSQTSKACAKLTADLLKTRGFPSSSSSGTR